jgi:hypothetical protein
MSALGPNRKSSMREQMSSAVLPTTDIRLSRTFLEFKETPESKIFSNEAFGYRKLTVERPLRLHSQLSPKAIETLRFASGDEDLRATFYEEFGDDLFTKFAKISDALETRLAEWGSEDDESDDEDDGNTKKGLPEKKKRNFSIPKPGSVTVALLKWPTNCAMSSAEISSRITTSFAIASTLHSERPASSSPLPI